MSPYDRLILATPQILDQARRSPMTGPLGQQRPWLRFAAFLGWTVVFFFVAGLIFGITTQIFPQISPWLTGEGGPFPETPLRLVYEGVEAIGLGAMLALLGLVPLLAAALAYRQPLTAFFWPSRRFDPMQFGVGVVGMACVAAIALPFYLWQGSEWAPPVAGGLYEHWTRPVYVALMAFGLLVAAAAEEVVFRGVLLRLTALVMRHPLVLCVVNGLLFSAIHLDPNPVAFVGRALSGAVWTWAALRLGGLEFATGAHLANNLIIGLVWAPLSEMEVGGDTPWIYLAPEVLAAVVMIALIERLAGRNVARPQAT